LTTHGRGHAEAFLPRDLAPRFEAGELVVVHEEAAGQNACAAFHPPQYVQRTLAAGFEVVGFQAGRVIDTQAQVIEQDSYLLRRLS
jgi:hypothetical protein